MLVEPSKPYMVLWDGDDGTRIDGNRPDSTHVDTGGGGGGGVTPLDVSVPAIVLSRTPGRWVSPLATGDVDLDWRAAHCQLAVEVGAHHIVASDGGHGLNVEAPALVAHAVDAVVDAVAGRLLRLDPDGVAAAGGRLSRCPNA